MLRIEDRYPIGAAITAAQLARDPYPVYSRLISEEPVSWLPDLGMWYVTPYDYVTEILKDTERFAVGYDGSTILDTFGLQMLSVDGSLHRQYRSGMNRTFQRSTVRDQLEHVILEESDRLIDRFDADGRAEMRAAFASTLPVRIMLHVFGLPDDDFDGMRSWYDDFEAALANFSGDEAVRYNGQAAVEDFHRHLQPVIDKARDPGPNTSMFGKLIAQSRDKGLSDEDIRRNASIVLFGGITTVEALILNSLWMVGSDNKINAQLGEDPSLADAVVREAARWRAPVQAAHRQVIGNCNFHGHSLRHGDIVSCVIGAANRDPAMFSDPDMACIDRAQNVPNLAFAQGPHVCLGIHLALAEARIAVARLFERLPGLVIENDRSPEPTGYEFHQPEALYMRWQTNA